MAMSLFQTGGLKFTLGACANMPKTPRRMEEKGLQGGHPPWGVISSFLSFSFGEVFAIGRVPDRERQTESEKSPPRGDGYAAIPSPPFSSQDLGHARTRAQCEFKPPGPRLEPRSTTWESSDIAITLTAGPCARILERRNGEGIVAGPSPVGGAGCSWWVLCIFSASVDVGPGTSSWRNGCVAGLQSS